MWDTTIIFHHFDISSLSGTIAGNNNLFPSNKCYSYISRKRHANYGIRTPSNATLLGC
jgi:hypothetical protein